MKRKKVLALMMAAAIAATAGAPAIRSEAAGLTQATEASKVVYGSLSAEDVALLQALFDYEYYKAQNPDLVEILGDDYAILFEHFCKCGIFEGRTCNPSFDPAAYASAYSDLKDVYGTDIVKYYEHYLAIGIKENRNITTLAACAEAGITVEALAGEEVKISPAAYQLALRLGTNDFATVQAAFDRAVAQASASGGSSSNGGSSSGSSASGDSSDNSSSAIVVSDTELDPIVAEAQGLEKVGEITTADGEALILYIVKAGSAYAAYKIEDGNYFDLEEIDEYTLVCSTDGFDSTAEDVILVGKLRISAYSKGNYGTSSSKTYDPTLDPYYEREETGEYQSTGNYVELNFDNYSSSEYDADISVKSTDTYERKSTLVGYYEDANYTVHEFTSDEDKNTWLEKFNEKAKARIKEEDPENYREGMTVVVSDYQEIVQYQDSEGTTETVYDVGLELEANEDGSLVITVGVSNEENNFGLVSEINITENAEEASE